MQKTDVRFWSKVSENGDCWEWTGAGTSSGASGHGQFIVKAGTKTKKRVLVGSHVYAYKTLIGNYACNLEIDHLCRNPKCVNPFHLEPVTHRENLLRGNGVSGINARKTHCPHGHPYDQQNTRYAVRATYTQRYCRECNRLRAFMNRRRKEVKR